MDRPFVRMNPWNYSSVFIIFNKRLSHVEINEFMSGSIRGICCSLAFDFEGWSLKRDDVPFRLYTSDEGRVMATKPWKIWPCFAFWFAHAILSFLRLSFGSTPPFLVLHCANLFLTIWSLHLLCPLPRHWFSGPWADQFSSVMSQLTYHFLSLGAFFDHPT